MLIIRHATIHSPEGIIADGTLRVLGDRISGFGPDMLIAEQLDANPDLPTLDARGLHLVPGLIDMQCNGFAGHDVLDGDPAVLRALAAALPRYGCTAVLPTLITASPETLLRGVRAIAEVAGDESGTAAAVLGTHLEGPWLSPEHRGAHPREWVRPYDAAELDALLGAAAGTLRLVTMAPELPGHMGAVARLAGEGILVSLGHSGVDYEGAVAAARAGARMATHLFNAMGPLHHRAPGLAGAALTLPTLVPSLIPDGHHVHPAIVRLAARARGPLDFVAITDSVPAAGLPPGQYGWQGAMVTWDGETVRLPDGTLAGSGLTAIEALRRLIAITGLSLSEALPAFTSTPARLLGQEQERGAIESGARADLLLLTDDLRVHTTLVGGRVAYGA